jgi:hypothetical protein
MRLSKSRWKLLVTCAAVPLAAAALLAGVIPASASAQPSAKAQSAKALRAEGCIELNLIDRIVNYYTNMNVSPASGHVGFKSAFFNQLYDSTGTVVVGSSVGTLDITHQLSNGDLSEYIAYQLQFPDGTLVTTGAYDRTDVIAEQWQSGPIKGTSGRYFGMSGTYDWRIISTTAPGIPVQEKIVLCR